MGINKRKLTNERRKVYSNKYPILTGFVKRTRVFLVEEEKKGGCFAVIVLQMYCYYQCSVALPHGAMG